MIHLSLQRFAEASYNVTTTNSTSGGVLSGPTAGFLFMGLGVLTIILIVSLWKIFTKAGKPGWAAIVPFYNMWVFAEIIGKPGWWGLYPLLGIIPFVGGIASLVITVIFALGLAKVFGKSVLFAVISLVVFPFIGYTMLAFGSAKYLGPDGLATGMAPPTGGAGPVPPQFQPPNAAAPFNPVPPVSGGAPAPQAQQFTPPQPPVQTTEAPQTYTRPEPTVQATPVQPVDNNQPPQPPVTPSV